MTYLILVVASFLIGRYILPTLDMTLEYFTQIINSKIIKESLNIEREKGKFQKEMGELEKQDDNSHRVGFQYPISECEYDYEEKE